MPKEMSATKAVDYINTNQTLIRATENGTDEMRTQLEIIRAPFQAVEDLVYEGGSMSADTSGVAAAMTRFMELCGSAGYTMPTSEPVSEPEPTAASGLSSEVQAAFSASYGWPDDPFWSTITGFTDGDAPRVTVVTNMSDKAENEAEAKSICMAVMSVYEQVESDFTGVYVTAGAGGPFIATCDVPSF